MLFHFCQQKSRSSLLLGSYLEIRGTNKPTRRYRGFRRKTSSSFAQKMMGYVGDELRLTAISFTLRMETLIGQRISWGKKLRPLERDIERWDSQSVISV